MTQINIERYNEVYHELKTKCGNDLVKVSNFMSSLHLVCLNMGLSHVFTLESDRTCLTLISELAHDN